MAQMKFMDNNKEMWLVPENSLMYYIIKWEHHSD